MTLVPWTMFESYVTRKPVSVERSEKLDCTRLTCLGASRQFGFLRFPTIQESKAFVERNHPAIHLSSKQANDVERVKTVVRIAFSKDREERERDRDRPLADGEWKCLIVGLPFSLAMAQLTKTV